MGLASFVHHRRMIEHEAYGAYCELYQHSVMGFKHPEKVVEEEY